MLTRITRSRCADLLKILKKLRAGGRCERLHAGFYRVRKKLIGRFFAGEGDFLTSALRRYILARSSAAFFGSRGRN
jgi:hypothetical protein